MYYINCRMCWVQLSGTQRPPVAFAVVLFLFLNLNRDSFQCQAECRENPAERTLAGAACQSGRGRCGKWRGAVSRESSRLRRIYVLEAENLCSFSIRKWGLASSRIRPPPGSPFPRLPLLVPANAAASLRCKAFAFRHFYAKPIPKHSLPSL